VVEGEGELQPILRDAAVAEEGAGIVDQHIDARLGPGNFPRDTLHLGEAREIGLVEAMAGIGRDGIEPRQRHPGAARIAGDEQQPRALLGQTPGGDLADAGCGAGDDDDLALHVRLGPLVRGKGRVEGLGVGWNWGLASRHTQRRDGGM
jgi:hypothetical protein